MPYTSESIPIAGTKHDLRVKLTQDAKDAIKLLSKQGYSQRRLAEMFRCSRRSIQNVLTPEPRKPQLKRSKEYWTEAKRRHRKHKQQLFSEGKIKLKTK